MKKIIHGDFYYGEGDERAMYDHAFLCEHCGEVLLVQSESCSIAKRWGLKAPTEDENEAFRESITKEDVNDKKNSRHL